MTAAPLARFGTLGDRSKAHVWTNAFEMPLSVRPNATIFHYDAITPEWKQKTEVKFSVLKSQEIIVRLQQRETRIFNPVGAFDRRHNLFSFVRYPLESASQSFYLDLDKDEQRRPRTVKVTVILVREVDLEILKRLRNASKDSISSALNLLNVFVQAQPKKDHLYNASSVFKFNKNTSDVVSIRPLELWRGVFQSVRPTFDRIVVNVDTTVGVVVPKTSLVQLCWTHLRDEVNLNHLGPQDFQQLRRFLRGIKVTVNHPGRLEPRAIKIRDLVQSVGEEVFEKTVRQKTGNVEVLRKVSITVAQHFRDSYNLTIPPGTLGIRGTHEMFPVMYCTTIQQLYRNKLSKDDAAEALKFGLRPPSKKLEDIKREWASLEHRQSEFLRGGGITFSASSHPLEVDGRKLNLPRITYGSSKIESIERDPGSWNMVGKAFKEPVAIGSWCIVNFTLSQITQFASKLRPAMQALGMVANEPKIKNGNASAPERALKEACREWQPDLILVMLNETDPDLYTMVKRFGDIKTGVRTQCIRWTKKLATAPSNQQNQYINNLLLKVNAKLGGINFVPEDAAMRELQSRDTMILGGDVSHPSPGSTLPSVAALVSSWDKSACKYAASVRVQRSRMEIIEDMEGMVMAALKLYYDKNNKLPRLIYYFRDGVSEGQFDSVFLAENAAIISACRQSPPYQLEKYIPDVAFVVCGKRHHTRFFPRDRGSSDSKGNCLPGLVVDSDSGFSHPHYVDFYLQSQKGIQGTSRPTHFTVLGPKRPPMNVLQPLTFALCHCYSRATKSVKIPAPVYYAHLACARAKFHYGEEVDYFDDISVSSDSPEWESKQLEFYQEHFHDVHPDLADTMYFV